MQPASRTAPSLRRASAPAVLGCLAAAAALALSGCSRSDGPARSQAAGTPAPAAAALAFAGQPIGRPVEGRPWITHVTVADVDGDELKDILVCDAQTNTIGWIRQSPRGVFEETQVGTEVTAPAHVEPCDVDGDGDLDLLVASMGMIFPNNDRIGAVVIIENLGQGRWKNRVVEDKLMRVSDVRGADLDADGRVDLVVGQFGYDQGEIRWLHNDGNGQFSSRKLLGLSGTIHTPVVDLDADGKPDIVALVSQEWEEVHLFHNAGQGEFRDRVLWGSTNEDYGSSGLDVADVDRDGDSDLIFANGDAFDYARPGPRPWHGLQWLENRGNGFRFRRISNMPGCYSPVCADLNGDGLPDLAAVSAFNKWDDAQAVSLMAWLNRGGQGFEPVVLARAPTHLVALAAGDFDGDGTAELVTGGFHAFPPWNHISRVMLWKRQ